MDDDVQMAEQALVGGLVLEPDRLGEVADLASPADFALPACGLVFARLLELHRAGSVTPQALLALLRDRGELRPDGYPAGEVAGWLERVPRAAALPVYARLVVDAATCRRVEVAGVRLVQLATRGEAEPLAVLAGATAVRPVLTAELRRLQALGVADVPAPGLPHGSVTGVDGSAAAGAEVAHAELVTVGAVLWAPTLVHRLGWLRPDDFASPGCAAVFGRVTAMVRDGSPVDRVTVHDQLRRHGDLDDRDAARLLARAEAAVPVPAAGLCSARQVLAGSASRRVAAAGERLVTLGRERRGGGAAVLTAGLAALDALAGLRVRISRSRGSAAAGRGPGMVRDRAVRREPARPVAMRS